MTGSKLKAKANTTCLHAPNLILYPIGHFRVPRGPLYQNKVKCSAFDKEMIFHSHANKISFLQERLCTWPHFESEGFWNSEVAR